jgi:tRNA-modifying protein YgfZ
VRNSPLHAWETQLEATFCESNGWVLPSRFAGPLKEYRSACESAAFFDRSYHAKVQITGPDAAAFLHNLCTNEIKGLEPGQGNEAFLTTGQAKIVAHVYIYREIDPAEILSFAMDAGPGMSDAVLKHLDRYLVSERAELRDRTKDLGQVHLAGPAASIIMDRIADSTLPGLARLHTITAKLGGVQCTVRRNDRLAPAGYDLLCKAEEAPAMAKALHGAGAIPAGLEAYETLRVEAGTPVFGVDMDETNLPQEVGRIDTTISFTKGCYIGQETVARIRTYGHVNRSLVGLKLESNTLPPRGTKIHAGDKEVGAVTSSVLSPRLETAIALAYLRRGYHEPGTKVEIAWEKGCSSAEVAGLPFLGGSAGS